MKTRAASAFTLLELLIVIVIVGVLTLLGLGAMGSIRASARQVECTTNLRQIYQALMARVSDLNGVFPSANQYPSYASWARNWDYDLIARKVLPGWEPFSCPAAPRNWPNTGFYIHYGMNSYLPPAEGGVPEARAFGRLSNVEHPARTVMLADSIFPNRTNPTSGFYLIADSVRIHGRHQGKANVMFVDGHLEQHTPESATQPESPLYRIYRQ